MSTLKDSAVVGRGTKLGKEGRGKTVFFFLSVSLHRAETLQCTTVCEQSCVLWYQLAIIDDLCSPDLTGQWAAASCRGTALGLPCPEKGWKIKLSMAIVDVFTPCLGISIATITQNPKLLLLVEVGSPHWKMWLWPGTWTLSACDHTL